MKCFSLHHHNLFSLLLLLFFPILLSWNKTELFLLLPVCLFSFQCLLFQIETTSKRSTNCSHLLSNMNYLDETRVGIWGWGYGGYVTAMVLGTQQHVYKCGVSVSPITDYLFYSKYKMHNVYFQCFSSIQFTFRSIHDLRAIEHSSQYIMGITVNRLLNWKFSSSNSMATAWSQCQRISRNALIANGFSLSLSPSRENLKYLVFELTTDGIVWAHNSNISIPYNHAVAMVSNWIVEIT